MPNRILVEMTSFSAESPITVIFLGKISAELEGEAASSLTTILRLVEERAVILDLLQELELLAGDLTLV
ncbi:unnamed protein product [Victoria cruziana]